MKITTTVLVLGAMVLMMASCENPYGEDGGESCDSMFEKWEAAGSSHCRAPVQVPPDYSTCEWRVYNNMLCGGTSSVTPHADRMICMEEVCVPVAVWSAAQAAQSAQTDQEVCASWKYFEECEAKPGWACHVSPMTGAYCGAATPADLAAAQCASLKCESWQECVHDDMGHYGCVNVRDSPAGPTCNTGTAPPRYSCEELLALQHDGATCPKGYKCDYCKNSMGYEGLPCCVPVDEGYPGGAEVRKEEMCELFLSNLPGHTCPAGYECMMDAEGAFCGWPEEVFMTDEELCELHGLECSEGWVCTQYPSENSRERSVYCAPE